jgi:hypothetical protein
LEQLATGEHAIEGLYVTEDEFRIPVDDAGKPLWELEGKVECHDHQKWDVRRGIAVIGVGEDKHQHYGMPEKGDKWGLFRDDALVYFMLIPGKPLFLEGKEWEPGYRGIPELTRIVVNLLYILQNTQQIQLKKHDPAAGRLDGKERTRRRQEENFARKGKSVLPYTTMRLLEPAKPRNKETLPGVERVSRRAHIVVGHIHHYWVKPGEKPALETKKNEKGTELHRVAHWLLPYRTGTGDLLPRTTRLRK